MNCAACRGACCETIIVPLSGDDDTNRWAGLHGVHVNGSRVALNCRCSALTAEGACSIYEKRPELCRSYLAGGQACLETVRALRTEAEYASIREEGDPEWADLA